jgi:hypothetical protein
MLAGLLFRLGSAPRSELFHSFIRSIVGATEWRQQMAPICADSSSRVISCRSSTTPDGKRKENRSPAYLGDQQVGFWYTTVHGPHQGVTFAAASLSRSLLSCWATLCSLSKRSSSRSIEFLEADGLLIKSVADSLARASPMSAFNSSGRETIASNRVFARATAHRTDARSMRSYRARKVASGRSYS